MDDGRVESVERDTNVTNRQGQTANWEGKASVKTVAGSSRAKATTATDNRSPPTATRPGPYGKGVVADVEGGRYGDRTVAAGRAYGGRAYAGTLPAGYRGYNYYGRSYYGYGGAYYRPYGASTIRYHPRGVTAATTTPLSSGRWR